MRTFFEPGSVVIYGASSTPGKVGYQMLVSLKSSFQGEIYPIHPNKDRLMGVQAYKSLDDVPETPELAVIALPATMVPDIIAQCGKKGTKRAVIISGGFKESGAEGEKLQKELLDAARQHGVRLIGPNCVGIYNPSIGLDIFFQPKYAMLRPLPGPVAFLTQSGTYGLSLLEWLAEEGIGVSRFASWGNRVDVDEVEMLDFLATDNATRVVVLYIEGLTRGAEFLGAVSRLARKKPVIVLKAGATEAGASAAKSHTASLSGDFALFRSLVTDAGAILVRDLEEMEDTLKSLVLQPLPPGCSLGLLTNGAGPCVVALDQMGPYMCMAELGEGEKQALRDTLPPFCGVDNPVDLTGSATAEWYGRALDVLAHSPSISVLAVFFALQDAPLANTADELITLLAKANTGEKTVVAIADGGPFTRHQGQRLQRVGIPFFPTASRAMRALEHVARYRSWLDRADAGTEAQPAPAPRVRPGQGLDEGGVKDLLKEYGIPVPEHFKVRSADELAGKPVSYPAVAKVCGSDILHKTELDGVKLNLANEEELKAAVQDITSRFPDNDVLIEPMESGKLELIAGIVQDPIFGQVIMAGLGGIFAEALNDVTFRKIPLSKADAERMLDDLKGAHLLENFRGIRPDRNAVVELLVNLSRLARDQAGVIEQLDLNPILVREDGCVVVDAKAVVRD